MLLIYEEVDKNNKVLMQTMKDLIDIIEIEHGCVRSRDLKSLETAVAEKDRLSDSLQDTYSEFNICFSKLCDSLSYNKFDAFGDSKKLEEFVQSFSGDEIFSSLYKLSENINCLKLQGQELRKRLLANKIAVERYISHCQDSASFWGEVESELECSYTKKGLMKATPSPKKIQTQA